MLKFVQALATLGRKSYICGEPVLLKKVIPFLCCLFICAAAFAGGFSERKMQSAGGFNDESHCFDRLHADAVAASYDIIVSCVSSGKEQPKHQYRMKYRVPSTPSNLSAPSAQLPFNDHFVLPAEPLGTRNDRLTIPFYYIFLFRLNLF